MKKALGAVFATLLSSGIGFTQEAATYAFLRNDVSARAAALNGSFVSMTNDPNVVFYNPAALMTIEKPFGSVSFLKHLLDVNAGSFSFGQELEGIGKIGAGVSYINYGSFNQTDQFLNNLGTFGATEFAVVAGIATPFDEESAVGANVKLIYSSIASYRSTGVAFDLGYLYFIPSENITIGASILNIGRQLKSYAGVREPLPLDFKIGITKRPEHLPVFLNLNFHRLNESQESFMQRLSTFSFGAEFLMSESVRFRVGYSNQQRKELKLGTSAGLAGFSLGGGIVSGDYRFDYAFNSYGKIGALHRVSIGTTF